MCYSPQDALQFQRTVQSCFHDHHLLPFDECSQRTEAAAVVRRLSGLQQSSHVQSADYLGRSRGLLWAARLLLLTEKALAVAHDRH